LPFQSTSVTSSPSTRYGPFCLTLMFAIQSTSSHGLLPHDIPI
jgi:hypothetical protein